MIYITDVVQVGSADLVPVRGQRKGAAVLTAVTETTETDMTAVPAIESKLIQSIWYTLTYCILFSPMVSGWAGGRREIDCLGCISETVSCRQFILGRDIGWGCRCATSWSDLDLTLP